MDISGRSIVLTRPVHQTKEFGEQLARLGAKVVVAPAIQVVPVAPTSVAGVLRSLDRFDWIVFTSANGVQATVDICKSLGVDLHAIAARKLAVIGEKTGAALQRLIRAHDAMPEVYLAQNIPAAMGLTGKERVLLLRADIAAKLLPQTLRELGCEVTEIDIYEVHEGCNEQDLHRLLELPSIDIVCFTSPSTVRGLKKSLEQTHATERLDAAVLLAIGPVTAQETARLFRAPEIVASKHTAEGMLEALLHF